MSSLITELLLQVANDQWHLGLSQTQLDQFERYAALLTEWNATRMNLTRLTEPKEIAVGHFLDSLMVLHALSLPEGVRLIDIGAGAGLPGLALKIARPDLPVTLLDSTAKKLTFCRAVADELGLDSVTTLHGRAEELGKLPEHAHAYGIVTARAVAPLERLLPWCAPFLSPDGLLIALKGSKLTEELAAARPVAKRLGLHFAPLLAIPLPEADAPTVRQILVARSRPGR